MNRGGALPMIRREVEYSNPIGNVRSVMSRAGRGGFVFARAGPP